MHAEPVYVLGTARPSTRKCWPTTTTATTEPRDAARGKVASRLNKMLSLPLKKKRKKRAQSGCALLTMWAIYVCLVPLVPALGSAGPRRQPQQPNLAMPHEAKSLRDSTKCFRYRSRKKEKAGTIRVRPLDNVGHIWVMPRLWATRSIMVAAAAQIWD